MYQKQHAARTVITAIIMMLSMAAVFSTGASAAEQEVHIGHKVYSEGGMSFYYADENGNYDDFDARAMKTYNETHQQATNLPSFYDARNDGLVTPVKDQGSTGGCWAFSAISALESNVIKRGLGTLENTDYSEAHLIWFAQNPNVSSTSDLAHGDGSNEGASSYTTGGNYGMVTAALVRGSGVVNDEDYPYYPYSPGNMGNYPESERYQSVMHLDSCLRLDTTNLNNYSTYSDADIKQAILDYGSVQGCYNSASGYTDTTSEYTSYYNYNDDNSINHAVAFVGWDDNFPKENFRYQPSKNGAWIIKNSWGTDGNSSSLVDGYMYISYEDVSLAYFAAYSAQPASSYSKVYTYTGADNEGYYQLDSAANVYKTSDSEILTEVGFLSITPAVTYKINVYTDLPADYTSPVQGTLHANVASGFSKYSGYITAELAEPIDLSEGEIFAVELIMTSNGNSVNYPIEFTGGTSNSRESYKKSGGTWSDCSAGLFGLAFNNVYIQAMTIPDDHIHVWQNPVVTPPTCSEQGYTTRTCECGKTQNSDYTAALGHLMGAYTCSNGVHTRACTRTGCTYSVSDACSYGSWTVTVPAGCTTAGTEQRTCTVCGASVTRSSDSLGHLYGSWVYNEGSGTHSKHCSRCGGTSTVSCSFGGWSVTAAATCTTGGAEKNVCSVCKGEKTRTTAQLGHLMTGWVFHDNFTHSRECSRAGCTYSENGSCTFGSWSVTTAATCTANGSSARSCSVCSGSDTRVDEAYGHSFGSFAPNGNGSHIKSCTNPGCTQVITAACDYETSTVPATCMSPDITTYVCKVCAYEKTVTGSVLPHSMGAWTSENGVHTRSCGNTGCTFTETENCSYGEWQPISSPTCTEKGSEKNTCTVCGGEALRDINALGHDMGEWAFNGTARHVKACKRTGCTYTESENCSFGEWVQITAPSCTAMGSEKKTCTACGSEVQRNISALGHDMSEWEYSGGSHSRHCNRAGCFAMESGSCEFGDTVTVNATCTANGSSTRICRVCAGAEVTVIPATGHTYTIQTVDATCTGEGYTVHTCHCGSSYREAVPALGHTDENDDGICDVCGENISAVKCDCMCHQSGFKGFFYKIMRIFWKLFGINKTCACGREHY